MEVCYGTSMNFISRFFKKSDKKNIYHPDYRDKVEKTFKLNGVQYYRFKDQINTPHLRDYYSDFYIRQYRAGIDFEKLEEYLTKIDDFLNKGKLGDAIYINRALKERIQANLGLDMLYNIASVCYFTGDEDLERYSPTENREKIKAFKEEKEDLSFFLTKPMIDIFPLLSSFVSDSEVFLKKMDLAKELTSEIDSLFLAPSDKDS